MQIIFTDISTMSSISVWLILGDIAYTSANRVYVRDENIPSKSGVYEACPYSSSRDINYYFKPYRQIKYIGYNLGESGKTLDVVRDLNDIPALGDRFHPKEFVCK